MCTAKARSLLTTTVTMQKRSLTSGSSERRFFACAVCSSLAAAEGAGRLSVKPGKLMREEVAED